MENKSARILRGIGIFFIAAIFSAGFSVVAYNQGNQTGYDAGNIYGYEVGLNKGLIVGFENGFFEGNDTGYSNGREDGIPKTFTSLAELRKWLARDDTNEQRWIETTHDCDDFAMALVDAANRDGYTMYVFTDLTYGWDGGYWIYTIRGVEYILHSDFLDIFSGHAYNFVVIGGDIWFIEPQTDKVWYGGSEL